jgi:hypothetical protein
MTVLCVTALMPFGAGPAVAAPSPSASVSVCWGNNSQQLELTITWQGFRANWWRHQLWQYDPNTTVGAGEEELPSTQRSGSATWILTTDVPFPTLDDLAAMDRGFGQVYFVDARGNETGGPNETLIRPAGGWPTCAPPTYQGPGSATVTVCKSLDGTSLLLTLTWAGFRANWWGHQLWQYDPNVTVGIGEEQLPSASRSGSTTWTLSVGDNGLTQAELDVMDRGYGSVWFEGPKGTTGGPYATVERPQQGWDICP